MSVMQSPTWTSFCIVPISYDENEEVARRLRQLALTYHLHGKRLHDANIVATMAAHGIRTLVTQNVTDFAPFDEIETMTVTGVSIGG